MLLIGIFARQASDSSLLLALSSVALTIIFIVSVLAYLFIYKKESGNEVLEELGISRRSFRLIHIIIGIALFALVLFFTIIITAISIITNSVINTNASQVLSGQPVWFYIFVGLISPIAEEIFFRGFLVKRIGILPSALIFGLAHTSYDSTYGVEIIAAFLFGIAAGYVFKKTKSLYPSMIGHILVNSINLVFFLFFIHL